MKKSALVFAFAFFLFMPCMHEAAAEPFRHSETGMVFPDQLADMDRGEVTDYEAEQPGLGVSVGYNAPGITLTIYLYKMGMESVPDNIESAIFILHFKQVVDDVVQAGQLGYYGNLKKSTETSVPLPGRKNVPRVLAASFSYTQNGVDRLSKLYLLPFRNHFLKVRFTYDTVVHAKAEDVLGKFLDSLALNVDK